MKAGSFVNTNGKLPGKQGTCKDRYRLLHLSAVSVWDSRDSLMYSRAVLTSKEPKAVNWREVHFHTKKTVEKAVFPKVKGLLH